ncbi:hypothetical protein J437_LFUL000042 [Ladona fulva]|uniref:Uncharacterized protein n=1 Tax=Ladona fulva TaxID=123851 RepID=A0A8K0NXB9_LADFU|nr:hypothetical protein J437_LFUL000042 [Ladona fulva]
MTGIRPLPQAKYQLLIESQRSNLHIKIVVVTAILIFSVIGVAVVGYFLYKDEYYQIFDTSVVPSIDEIDDLPVNHTVSSISSSGAIRPFISLSLVGSGEKSGNTKFGGSSKGSSKITMCVILISLKGWCFSSHITSLS